MAPIQLLKTVASKQLPSGQFPTIAQNVEEGWERHVGTLTPTYLICLMLTLYRERHGSHLLIDRMIKRCLGYIENRCYHDPIEGYRVWHFNCFYPPDWEEICWCSFLLYQEGRISKRELEPLYRLMRDNETEEYGVGVWIRDNYRKRNGLKNAFDPFASLAIQLWLNRVFNTRSQPTDQFLVTCVNDRRQSLYYFDDFYHFFLSVFGLRTSRDLPEANTPLFHQGPNQQVHYGSPDVWRVASLLT